MSDEQKAFAALPPGRLTSFVMRLAAQGLAEAPVSPNGGRRMPVGWGPRDTTEQKYEVRVVRAEQGCWSWIGAVNPMSGYACIGKTYAHRWSYEHHIGPIPDGLTIDHLCCVKTCTNPAHLEAVTGAENIRRAQVKPTCKKDHPWTEASTYITPSTGRRMCRICAAAKMRRFRARRTAARRAAA